jgi:lipoprotein-anchoring transpeptidase ErfK/SrfK
MVRRTGRILLALLLAVIVCGAGTAAAIAQQEPEPYEPVVVDADPFRFRGSGDAAELVPIHRFDAGTAAVPELVAYAGPNPASAAEPVASVPNPTHEGFPLVVSIIERSADGQWAHVRLPQRPNGLTGWVRSSDLATWTVPNRVEVTLRTNTLRVFDGDSDVVLFEAIVATGRPNTPTPLGDFYIDIVNPLGGHAVYGWGQLSVAGFSDVLERFAGGIGQIAIHGWNDDSVMGSAASNGCVRMRNVDIEQLAALAPLGTPVRIVP